MTYRVALIGAGTMGGVHARHWNAIPGTELVGVLDPRPGAAAAVGPAYGDWDTLLSQSKPDIIDICTPTPFHREYVERAAAAGKAIFVEKPMARSLADCDAMIEAVERAGVPAMSCAGSPSTPPRRSWWTPAGSASPRLSAPPEWRASRIFRAVSTGTAIRPKAAGWCWT